MDLMVYNENLESQGVVDVFDSLIWIRRYAKSGSFQLTAPATKNNLSLLEKYNIIQKNNDSELAYITSINISSSNDDGDIIVAEGYFYENILSQRCVLNNATNLKSLITNNLRGLNLIQVDSGVSSITFSEDFTGKNLLECVTTLASRNDFGFKTVLDRTNKKIIFEIFTGIDRSINQSDNLFCIFSDNCENLLEYEYADSTNGVINTVYARCDIPIDAEPCIPPTYEITEGTGVKAFESYVLVKAVTYSIPVYVGTTTVNKIYVNESATLQKMILAANDKIVAHRELFHGTVDFKLNYKSDYDIGDIVTIRTEKWKKETSRRIEEVTEVYDNLENSIVPTFGSPLYTLNNTYKRKD